MEKYVILLINNCVNQKFIYLVNWLRHEKGWKQNRRVVTTMNLISLRIP